MKYFFSQHPSAHSDPFAPALTSLSSRRSPAPSLNFQDNSCFSSDNFFLSDVSDGRGGALFGWVAVDWEGERVEGDGSNEKGLSRGKPIYRSRFGPMTGIGSPTSHQISTPTLVSASTSVDTIPLHTQYFPNAQGIIFVTDPNHREQVSEMRETQRKELPDTLSLIFANEQHPNLSKSRRLFKRTNIVHASEFRKDSNSPSEWSPAGFPFIVLSPRPVTSPSTVSRSHLATPSPGSVCAASPTGSSRDVHECISTDVFGSFCSLASFRLTGGTQDYAIIGSDSGPILPSNLLDLVLAHKLSRKLKIRIADSCRLLGPHTSSTLNSLSSISTSAVRRHLLRHHFQYTSTPLHFARTSSTCPTIRIILPPKEKEKRASGLYSQVYGSKSREEMNVSPCPSSDEGKKLRTPTAASELPDKGKGKKRTKDVTCAESKHSSSRVKSSTPATYASYNSSSPTNELATESKHV
ncbi:hypothetical protein BDP27DRAFT_1425669 [Rhodocollybia butyracea]|uniref:Uncharacterized protein n=1 Tax=Rhodocollybia butyracea TaxID=206335 RepID=A0A9P5PJX2_9AGAR|nr:hypothetical protein BDP27DRAFT_1425669 [Rhodocollybia butyracea]